MKPIKYIIKSFALALAAAAPLLMTGCKENPIYDKEDFSDPVITSFAPVSGPVYTEITIEGTNLQRVNRAYIGGEEVQVRTRVTNEKLVIVANGNTSGEIKLVSTINNAVVETHSDHSFTYVYVQPEVSTALVPSTAEVGTNILLLGTNMLAVKEVFVVDAATGALPGVRATLLNQTNNEVLITVPYSGFSAVNFYVTYFNGTDIVSTPAIEKDVNMVVNRPVINSLSASTVNENGSFNIDGTFLDRVNKVTIDGREVTVASQTGSLINVAIPIDVFPDGNNTGLELVLHYFESAQQLAYPSPMTIYVPEMYFGVDQTINGRARNIGVFRSFYSLRLGKALENSDFGTSIDPIGYSNKAVHATGTWEGLPCNPANITNKSVVTSEEEYFSVFPYFHVLTNSTGIYISGPANTNNALRNLYSASSGLNVIGINGTTNWACGTPVLMFVPIDRTDPVAASVRSGTLTKISSENFPVDVDARTIGGISVASAAGRLQSTSWAPGMTQGQENNDLAATNNDGVFMVIYYDYNHGYDSTNPAKGVYKIGFVHVKKFSYLPASSEPSASLITLDSYWQKRPYNPVL